MHCAAAPADLLTINTFATERKRVTTDGQTDRLIIHATQQYYAKLYLYSRVNEGRWHRAFWLCPEEELETVNNHLH